MNCFPATGTNALSSSVAWLAAVIVVGAIR